MFINKLDEGALKIKKTKTCRFLFIDPRELAMQKFFALAFHSRTYTKVIVLNLIALAS